ncbi:hypothetical protein I79_005436 [Cricetulus griseus]|uniref:Uncharacterized protein n=1 Tax=Cricetulus griseus TaxID=10029 RepID=G3H564_CRIGR|nr:hypothetical protein I79_005436 [Cricetulus griseus]
MSSTWSRVWMVWIPYKGTGQADSPDWERQTQKHSPENTAQTLSVSVSATNQPELR